MTSRTTGILPVLTDEPPVVPFEPEAESQT